MKNKQFIIMIIVTSTESQLDKIKRLLPLTLILLSIFIEVYFIEFKEYN